MKLALFAYSRQGCGTAERIAACFPEEECGCFAPARIAQGRFQPIPQPSGEFYAGQFRWADCLIFVGSCGIAVRQIAPSVRDKLSDPAVLCVDELGKFVIPLLSGHVGGANADARLLAVRLGAVPVITTATDINSRFSVDTWAAERDFLLDDRSLAKEVSASVLEGTVPVLSDYPVRGGWPAGITPGFSGDLGIYIGHTLAEPFTRTLRVIPKVLHLGIGCRKGTPEDAIRRAVEMALSIGGLDIRAVKCAASINLKAEEEGLLAYCRHAGIPIRFYDAASLAAVPGDFTSSDFVRSVAGVENVCERSAMAGAETLLVKKTIADGVTAAVAAERLEIRFE